MKRYLQIGAIYTVIFTQMLDTSIVNLALVKIAPDLGIVVYNSAWIITAFGTGMVISFPLSNSLCKKFCIDALFIVACTVFMVSSFACSIAYGEVDFILYRFVQGLSSGILIVLCQSLLFRILGDEKRALALALWSSAMSIAPIAGPLIGGLIVEYHDWRWLFLINLPLMLVCLYILQDVLQPIWKVTGSARIQVATLAAFAITIALTQFILDFGERLSWLSNNGIRYSAVGAIAGLITFIILNQDKTRQVFDFSVFSDRNYRSAMAIMIIGNGLIFASLVVLPVWLQTSYKMPAIHAGLVVAIGSGVVGLLSPLIGKYLKRDAFLFASILSLLLTGLSFGMMSRYTLDSTFQHLAQARIVAGLGLVLFATPLAALSLMTIKPQELINANAISICLRVLSSNFFVAFGFILLQNRQHEEYERYLSAINRQFIIEYIDKNFTQLSYITDHVATLAMQGVFSLSAIAFFILFCIIVTLNIREISSWLRQHFFTKQGFIRKSEI